MFARELGSDRAEKIKRLNRQASYQPSIDLIGDILKRFPNIDPIWLISGAREMFIPDGKINSSYNENCTTNKVEEPCSSCEKLKAEKMKLLEDLNELNAKYRHLLETGTIKKEILPQTGT